LAAKLLVLNPANNTLQLLGRYALTLARYDQDYDVRDRARSIATLLMGVAPVVLGDEECSKEEYGGVILRREQVRMVLFEHKATVKEAAALEGAYSFVATHPGAYAHQE
jgi:AP-3 complex subunit beta